ncbi:MAG: alkaline phosphatase family protein [Candidatus Izimaplasma sp.]|nr:alkaline phosphatase family protein [Candidatus Izimaplasma bacterium]
MKTIYPDYNRSIMNVSNSLLKYFNVPYNYATLDELDEILTDDFDHITLMLLDGLGSNLLDIHRDVTSFLNQHKKTDITSIYPPTTVAATNAVLSGRPPISTGYVGWTQYFPHEDVNLAVFENVDYYTKDTYKEVLRDKYLSYDSITDKIANHNKDVTVSEFWPAFRTGGSKTFEEQLEKLLLTVHNHDQTFNYVYHIEPDLSQHHAGIKSMEVKAKLNHCNKLLKELQTDLPDNSLIILIADHGLIDVNEVKFFDYDLEKYLLRKPSLEPRITNFFVKDDSKSIFETKFKEAFGNKFTLYSRDAFLSLDLLGIGKPHETLLTTLGDYISIANDNDMLSLSKDAHKAHHAGLSQAEMIVPLIIIKNN